MSSSFEIKDLVGTGMVSMAKQGVKIAAPCIVTTIGLTALSYAPEVKKISNSIKSLASRTPCLTTNLTREYRALANEGKLKPFAYNRQTLIEQVESKLLITENSAILLHGEPGCGKTAIFQQLVYRQVTGQSPAFADYEFIMLNNSQLQSIQKGAWNQIKDELFTGGARGEFDQLFQGIEGKKYILFIDESQAILDLHVLETKLNPLSRGQVKLVLATTTDECYSQYDRWSGAMQRRIPEILVKEFSIESMIEALKEGLPNYNDMYGVKIDESALPYVVLLSNRQEASALPKKQLRFPHKAVHLLGEICSAHKIGQPSSLTISVEEILSYYAKQYGYDIGLLKKEIEQEIQDLDLRGLNTAFHEQCKTLDSPSVSFESLPVLEQVKTKLFYHYSRDELGHLLIGDSKEINESLIRSLSSQYKVIKLNLKQLDKTYRSLSTQQAKHFKQAFYQLLSQGNPSISNIHLPTSAQPLLNPVHVSVQRPESVGLLSLLPKYGTVRQLQMNNQGLGSLWMKYVPLANDRLKEESSNKKPVIFYIEDGETLLQILEKPKEQSLEKTISLNEQATQSPFNPLAHHSSIGNLLNTGLKGISQIAEQHGLSLAHSMPLTRQNHHNQSTSFLISDLMKDFIRFIQQKKIKWISSCTTTDQKELMKQTTHEFYVPQQLPRLSYQDSLLFLQERYPEFSEDFLYQALYLSIYYFEKLPDLSDQPDCCLKLIDYSLKLLDMKNNRTETEEKCLLPTEDLLIDAVQAFQLDLNLLQDNREVIQKVCHSSPLIKDTIFKTYSLEIDTGEIDFEDQEIKDHFIHVLSNRKRVHYFSALSKKRRDLIQKQWISKFQKSRPLLESSELYVLDSYKLNKSGLNKEQQEKIFMDQILCLGQKALPNSPLIIDVPFSFLSPKMRQQIEEIVTAKHLYLIYLCEASDVTPPVLAPSPSKANTWDTVKPFIPSQLSYLINPVASYFSSPLQEPSTTAPISVPLFNETSQVVRWHSLTEEEIQFTIRKKFNVSLNPSITDNMIQIFSKVYAQLGALNPINQVIGDFKSVCLEQMLSENLNSVLTNDEVFERLAKIFNKDKEDIQDIYDPTLLSFTSRTRRKVQSLITLSFWSLGQVTSLSRYAIIILPSATWLVTRLFRR